MSSKRTRLPSRLPAGSKYVLEIRGKMKGSLLVNRYVELPDGRRVELAARLVAACEAISDQTKAASSPTVSIREEALA